MSPGRSWAVLFDVDGTLLDTVGFILASMRHAFDGHPRPPSDAEWLAQIGTPLRAIVPRYTTDPEEEARVTERYRAYQRAHHDTQTAPFPGAVNAVRDLAARGHPIGIVTGKSNVQVERSLAHVGLAPLVGVVIGADSCPEHKPSPVPVRLALQALARRPEEAVFVGDSPLDVLAGNAAGVVTVGALWGAASRDALAAAGAKHLLGSVAEVPALVARLAAGE